MSDIVSKPESHKSLDRWNHNNINITLFNFHFKANKSLINLLSRIVRIYGGCGPIGRRCFPSIIHDCELKNENKINRLHPLWLITISHINKTNMHLLRNTYIEWKHKLK